MEALAGDFEEEDGGRGGDVEGIYPAEERDGEDLGALFPDQWREAPAFGAEDDADRNSIIEDVPESLLPSLGSHEPEAFFFALLPPTPRRGEFTKARPRGRRLLLRSLPLAPPLSLTEIHSNL